MNATRLIVLFKGIAFVAMAWLSLPSLGHAQQASVAGRVVDKTGGALPGVNVFVEGTTHGTTTGMDGRYRLVLESPGTMTIVASAVGFKRGTTQIVVAEGQEATVDFVLTEVVIETGEVVVTASRRAQLASMVPASLTVMSARELDTRNVVELDDALRYVSGLQMQDNQVNLRGSSGFAYNTGSRVLLLLDGAQLLTPETDGVPLDIVPMTQVEQIEVLKGPGSALYGSGALGGVINVITKAFPAEPRTGIQTYGGFYEKAKYDVWRNEWQESEDLRWFAGFRFDHARKLGRGGGGWLSLSYRKDIGYMNLQQNRLLQAYAKIGFQLSRRWQGDVLFGGQLREKDTFLFWNGLADPLNPGKLSISRSPDPTGSNDNFSNQFNILPTFRYFPNSTSLLTGRLRFFGTVIRPIDNLTGKTKPVSEGTVGFRYGAELQYTRTLAGNSTLTVGTNFDANTTRSSFYLTRDGDELGSQPEIAVFGQWEGALSRAVSVVGGLRFDWYRVDATETVTRLSPKAAVSYVVSEGLVARLAAGMGFRVPSLAERFTENVEFIPIYRNPRLKPETGTSVEIGLRGWLAGAGPVDGIEWDVSGFWNDYRDFIEPRFVNGPNSEGVRIVGFQFINLDDGRIAGVEVNVSGVLLNDLVRVTSGYTFLDTRDPSGDELPYRPRHLLISGATMKILPWLDGGIDYRYASIPGTIDSDFAIFVQDANVLEETHSTDVRLMARWRGITTSLLVNNVFNYYYLERVALLAPPRYFTLKLQLDF